MTQDEMLAEALAQLAEMRAALDHQQEINAQQQAAISALQRQSSLAAGNSGAEASLYEVTDDMASAQTPTETAPVGKRGKVGRRGLLLGAAGVAGATVAAAATVAINSPQPVEAATGNNFVLGQQNDAGAVTSLVNTTSTMTDLLNVTATHSVDIRAIMGAAFVGDGSGITPWSAPRASTPGSGTGGMFTTIGVLGVSDDAVGVLGQSGFLDIVAGGSGRIWQIPQSQAGAPTTNNSYQPGESIRDANGDMWLCTGYDNSYNPVWAKVALLAPGATSGGAITYLSKPIRLFDSRPGATALFHPGTTCKAGTSTKVQVAGDSYNGVTVPASLSGAIGNVTVLDGSGAGFVEIVPSGAGFTGAANLAFGPGQIVSNAFNVGLSGGALDIYVGSSNADVIIDLFAVVA